MARAKHLRGLQLHNGQYRYVRQVPSDLVDVVGVKNFVVYLKSDSLSVAVRRSAVARAEVEERIKRYRLGLASGDGQYEVAASLRQEIERDQEQGWAAASAWLEDIETKYGEEEAQRLAAVVKGERTSIVQSLEAILKNDTASSSLLNDKRLAVRLLNESGVHHIEEVDRKRARKFVEGLIEDGTRSRATINKLVTRLHSVWNAFEITGIYEGSNPWSRQTVRAVKSKRRAFDPKELAALLKASRGWVNDVITVLAAHGLRIGEFFALNPGDVTDKEIAIRVGKTDAAERFVPIHTQARDALKRVGPDGERVSQVVFRKAFKTALERAGLQEKSDELKIHSLRMYFYSERLKAGVPNLVLNEVVGHENPTLVKTYGSGFTFEQKLAVVEAVNLPVVKV